MSDEDTQVLFKIPEKVIQAQINAAVFEALNAHGGGAAMIRTVVDSVLNEPSDDYHRKRRGQTKFGDLIRKVIWNIAHEAFREWLEEKKPVVKEMIRDALDPEADQKVIALVEKLADASLRHLYANIKWGSPDD